jgi:hypothetical protein
MLKWSGGESAYLQDKVFIGVHEICFLLRSFGHLDVGNDRELKINYLLFLKWKIFRIGKVTNDFVFRQKMISTLE